jgi:hypothetical protein
MDMRADILKKLRLVSAAAGIGCLIFLFGIWLPREYAGTKRHLGMDAYVYYVAANLALMRHSPYTAPTPPYLKIPSRSHPVQLERDPYGPDYTPICYVYSPQFAILFAPFVVLPQHACGCLWETLLAVTLVAYALILAALIKPDADKRDRIYTALSIFPILMFSPNVLFNIGMGNVDLILSTLIGAAFVSKRRTEIFAVVGQIKPFALLPLALDCVRDRRQIPRAAIILITGCMIGAAVCGLESFAAWRTVSANVLGQGTFLNLNWSMSFAGLRLLRWLGIWHYTSGPLSSGPRLYLALAGSLGVIATVFATRRLPHLERCAACLLGATLFSPICWPNYLVVGYIYLALRLRRFLEKRNEARTDLPIASPLSEGITVGR